MQARLGRPPTSDHVFLIGRPPIQEYLSFIKSFTVDGEEANEGQLCDEWRRANDRVQVLEEEEKGYADGPYFESLPLALQPMAAGLMESPLARQSYSHVPTDVVMVELDRLVVFQKHIDLDYVAQLRGSLGENPTEEEIFRFCVLSEHTRPEVMAARVADNAFVLTSPSNDLRFLGTTLLPAEGEKSIAGHGYPAATVGLHVGYGSNVFNAVHLEDRLVLANGSHRAFCLREMGVTHAPAIVQHVTRSEERDLVAPRRVRANPKLYLKHPRPSVLKDYFDPELRMVAPVARKLRQVRVAFEIDVMDVPPTA